MMLTYPECAEKLKRARGRGKLANNTYLRKEQDGTFRIRLHDTDVVHVLPNGHYRLYTGGWRTLVTKNRINTYSPVHVAAYQGTWLVGSEADGWQHSWAFEEGMEVNSRGRPLDAARLKKRKAAAVCNRRAVNRRVREYVDGYCQWLLDLGHFPTAADCAGDCFYCRFVEENPHQANCGHLVAHMRERYYVGSILHRTLQERYEQHAGAAAGNIERALALGRTRRAKEELLRFFKRRKDRLVEAFKTEWPAGLKRKKRKRKRK